MKSKQQNKLTIADAIYENISEDLANKIYNAGFVDLSHKRTKNQNDTLIDRVSLLCESNTFDISEWVLSGMQYHDGNPTACICGKTNLKKRYVMENLQNHSKISVGSSCLEKHFELFLDKETLDAMEYAKGSGGKYSWLGAKYDAMIFFVLGFKKSMLYFEDRRNKKIVDKEIDKLLKNALLISLSDFNSTKWHERLERGRRLYKRFIDNIAKAKKLSYIQEDLEQKRARVERARRAVTANLRLSEKDSYKTTAQQEALYEKTEVQDTELLKSLGISIQVLSKDDIRTINTMKNYYKAQTKYRNDELTKEYSVLHTGRNLLLISYKRVLYALALIGLKYYIYQVINENELFCFGKVYTESEVSNEIDRFHTEQENIF